MRALLEEQMIGRLHDIHAMEADVQRLLDEMIEKTDDPQFRGILERHVHDARHHEQRLIERLQAHGESARPGAASAGGEDDPSQDTPSDDRTTAAEDEEGHAARDGLITARVKNAFYRQLERAAKRVGDEQTAQVARRNREQEQELTQTMSAAVRAGDAPR